MDATYRDGVSITCIQTKGKAYIPSMDLTESVRDRESSVDSCIDPGGQRDSAWVRDKAADYDFCAVLPLENDNELSKIGRDMIVRFRSLGIETFVYKTEEHAFVLLSAPVPILRKFAHSIEFGMQLDATELRNIARVGYPDKGIGPVDIAHDPDITSLTPFEYIYGPYSTGVNELLYRRPRSMQHPFSERHRLKLTRALIESKKFHKNPIKIRRYILKNSIKAFFPLHNGGELEWFAEHWLPWRVVPWNAPVDRIKNYFGEKIGLYFVFIGHYSRWLVVPTVIGIPIQIYVLAVNDFSSPVLPFFSVFIVLWAIVMLEYWKRKEKMQAMMWGTVGFEMKEVDRPEFKGELKKSVVNGKETVYFPNRVREKYISQSMLVIGSMIMLVLGVVGSIYVIRAALTPDMGSDAQYVASILNAIQIQVFNFLYSMIADFLTERENHRTDTEFEDAMIQKLFVFQFVNSYSSFFFLAFVATSTNADDDALAECAGSACMVPLSINLFIIFGSRLLTGNLTELLIPYLQYRWRSSQRKNKHLQDITRPHSEFLLEPYDPIKSTLKDYSELAIQFGYIALFVTALPAAAFAGLVSSYIESKGDAWKLTHLHQRPIPRGAEDIGTWQSIFTIVSVAAVLTNAGLTCFTMDTLDPYSESTKYIVFIIFQLTCFSIQYLLMDLIADVPEEINIQLQRSEFLNQKFILQVPDDDYNASELGVPTSNIENDIVFEIYPGMGVK